MTRTCFVLIIYWHFFFCTCMLKGKNDFNFENTPNFREQSSSHWIEKWFKDMVVSYGSQQKRQSLAVYLLPSLDMLEILLEISYQRTFHMKMVSNIANKLDTFLKD